MSPQLDFRLAEPADLPVLTYWDAQQHVLDSDPNDDWNWEVELVRRPAWREQWLSLLDGKPLGFLEIIDPELEEDHYWGEIAPGHRAIDIWIGEVDQLGKGYGTRMMEFAINRCFAPPEVHTIVIDPLASNVRAQRFYGRLGFQFRERRRFGLDDCFVFALTRERWVGSSQLFRSVR